MELAMKYHTIDDRYWFDACKTVCKNCRHLQSLFDKTCAAYPQELPPKFWNGQKKCPKREERTN